MINDLDAQCELLNAKIKEFQASRDLEHKGLLLGECNSQMNQLQRHIKEDQSGNRHISSRVHYLDVTLLRAQTSYLQELDLAFLFKNAIKLSSLMNERTTDSRQVDVLVDQIKVATKKINQHKLGAKERKQYEDALKIANLASNGDSENHSPRQEIMQEIHHEQQYQQDDEEEEQLTDIVKDIHEVNSMATLINVELANQGEHLDCFEMNVGEIRDNVDCATTESIEAHDQFLQAQKKKIKLMFASFFGILTPLLIPFGFVAGGVAGGVAGYATGGVVAQVSQAGLHDKVKDKKN